MPATPLRLLVVHDDDLGMRFGGDHPTDRRRHQLAVALCRESGLLDTPGVERRDAPGPLDDEALAGVFAPAFIRAIQRYSANPVLASTPEAAQWGIGGDNNAYPGMHEDSARACSACADGDWRTSSAVCTGSRSISLRRCMRHSSTDRRWFFGMMLRRKRLKLMIASTASVAQVNPFTSNAVKAV